VTLGHEGSQLSVFGSTPWRVDKQGLGRRLPSHPQMQASMMYDGRLASLSTTLGAFVEEGEEMITWIFLQLSGQFHYIF